LSFETARRKETKLTIARDFLEHKALWVVDRESVCYLFDDKRTCGVGYNVDEVKVAISNFFN